MRLAPSLCAAVLLAACRGGAPASSDERSPSAARASSHPAPSASVASSAARATASASHLATAASSSAPPSTSTPLPPTTSTIRISAAEAKRFGLPAIGFTIDPGGHSLGAAAMQFPGSYLTLTGPPGSIRMLDVRSFTGAADDANALATLRARLEKRGTTAELVGAPELVDVAGAMRPARAGIAGKGISRAHWCVALVRDPGVGDGGLALFAATAALPTTKPSCATVLATSLGPVVRTLRLTGP